MQKHLDWFTAKRPRVDCTHIPLGTYHEPIMLTDDSKLELLLFNMLAPFKGIEMLLEVFNDLKLEFPKLQLTIAGEEHPRFVGYAQTIRERYGHIKGVRWLSKIRDEDIAGLFQSAQVVVLPYKASTGASSSIYQAAGLGRAIVASNLSEIRSLVQEENFCVEFFETGNTESLRDAIRNLLNSPEKRRAQVLHNFRSIQNARIENTCHRYLQAFNRALEKRNSLKRIHIPQIEVESA
jgi:glycosyltransferase involved in cell wall biosynthesis